jgi:hypothetical protein
VRKRSNHVTILLDSYEGKVAETTEAEADQNDKSE